MTYNAIIVGGGLSGLYHAYKLTKAHPKWKIHLFQDSSRLGGRFYTYEMDNGTKVNMGAGRIATHHPKTMKLIKELGLKKDLIPLTNQPLSLDPLHYFENEKDALTFLVRLAKTTLHKIPKKYLTSMSFQKVCNIFFAKKTKQIEEAIFVSGYDTEFEIGNAWVICHTILDMFDPNLKFATIRGGLGRIIDCLVEKCKKQVVIHTSSPVLGWKKTETKVWTVYYRGTEKEVMKAQCNHLHIATPLEAWKTWFQNQTIRDVPVSIKDVLRSIEPVSLCRMYTTYKDSKWVSVISKCVTKGKLRYIIPINENTVMISYLDGERADELANMDETELRDWVTSGTQQSFPGLSRFIPEPSEIKRGYWKVGVHVWKPMKHSQPPAYFKTEDDSFSFSGEAFSQLHQGWMEGALQNHTTQEKEN